MLTHIENRIAEYPPAPLDDGYVMNEAVSILQQSDRNLQLDRFQLENRTSKIDVVGHGGLRVLSMVSSRTEDERSNIKLIVSASLESDRLDALRSRVFSHSLTVDWEFVDDDLHLTRHFAINFHACQFDPSYRFQATCSDSNEFRAAAEFMLNVLRALFLP